MQKVDNPFLVSARKGRKEADLRGGFSQSRPLLKITPPTPEDILCVHEGENVLIFAHPSSEVTIKAEIGTFLP